MLKIGVKNNVVLLSGISGENLDKKLDALLGSED